MPSDPHSFVLRGPYLACLLVLVTSWTPRLSAQSDTTPSYSREIRPILARNCFACHGPDASKRKAETRLDIPGGADLTEVVRRITSTDPDVVMPPPRSHKTLAANDVERLRRWIDDGAPYESHWAFVPPRKIEIPQGAHPIDYFVDRKLRKLGQARSPQADPYTRIRRVYLDLIGLPPTPEEADAFAAHPTQAAFESIVDRLLASPRYGERQARRWLDLARYADTNGYEKDRDRSIWPYRDWVIRAFNADLPFDQFTIEQLAGDMLPNPTPDQLVATGFHRNTMLNEEGGIDPLEFRYHAMTDRVATTGTTWLGLTTGCAQCHSHKYDPLTHAEYFGLMAYLDNADEIDFDIPSDRAKRQREQNHAEADQLARSLADRWPTEPTRKGGPAPRQLETALKEWIESERENAVDWSALLPRRATTNLPYLSVEADGTVFASGDISKHDIYTLDFIAQRPITALRLEALPDARLPRHGPGMAYYEGPKGEFFLSEFEVERAGRRVGIQSATETYARNSFGRSKVSATQATDGDLQSGWSINGGFGRRHVAVFELAEPIPHGATFKIRMHFGRHFAASLGRFRISGTATARVPRATLTTPSLQARLAQPDAADDPAVREAFLMQAPELAKHAEQIHRIRRRRPGPQTMILRQRPLAHPRETRRRHRGEFTQPREAITPHLPAALHPPGQPMPKDRLGFARWLVSRENPLTARVLVNREWASIFGTGIVKTVDNFGLQGEPPSHSRLLDYLAVDFMEGGWSFKALHRRIVTSAVYSQSSRVEDPSTLATDRRNLRLFPRTRLEAEVIRDSILAASGLLETKMFGPPVRPPQPVTQAANYTKSKWVASKGADRYRRSLYTYQKRTAPFEMFTTFDAGSGESCIAQRSPSNTPLQALTLMNDPMFLEMATAYGKRMEAVPGNFRAKATAGFRWLLTRSPTAKEIGMLHAFHTKHRTWTALARVLLSLDESITKN